MEEIGILLTDGGTILKDRDASQYFGERIVVELF
jgi:hypothetical protein